MSSLMGKIGHTLGQTLSRRNVSANSKSADTLAKDDTRKLKRVKVATILLGNDLDLLAALCQSNFVGDAAAAIASTIISLLRKVSDESCNDFVKRILKTKILIYASKGKRLTDLLRDNSMSTMILTSFARSVGAAYLKETLTEPMSELLVYFNELDSLNSKEDALAGSSHSLSTTNTAEKHMDSERKLLAACLSILNSILTNFDKMPYDMQQICRYLKMEVESIVLTSSQGLLISAVTDTANQRTGEVKDRSRKSSVHRRISTLQAAEKSSPVLKEEPEDPEGAAQIADLQTGADRIKSTLPHEKDPLSGGSEDSNKSIIEANGREIQNLASPIQLATATKELVPDDFAQKDASTRAIRSMSELSSVIDVSEGSVSRSATVVSEMADEAGEPFEDPILTLSERVVGTFLFLRFFVPAVTAPESYGFLQGKVNATARKKLILCGKILNGFCSEADFRQKEPQLLGVTEFLEVNKPNLKTFITKVTMLEQDALDTRSANSITIGKRKSVGEIEADEHLMLYLSRSLSRIEKDLGTILKSMTVDETKNVEDAFQALKQELESYNQLQDSPVKEQTFMAKIGHRLELFKKSQRTMWSSLQKSKSTDDIAHIRVARSPEGGRRKQSTGSLIGITRKNSQK